MATFLGVNLLPASGEWVYDTVPHRGLHAGEGAFVALNLNAGPAGTKTDYSVSLDQLQAQYPACRTVNLIVAWFGSSTDVAACRVYPSTTFVGGQFQALVSGNWQADPWRCSGLTQASPGLIPISTSGGTATYGGTPSDQAVVRCIRDLKARGLRVVFYPFLLMDCPGYPWRGRIGWTGADKSTAAASAVNTFLGPATPSQFTRDATNLTVSYAGSPTDFTFRRMILHYAHLCVVAGGVDLFLVGSELRGLEAIRGPAWTKAGTVGSDGRATWDYPFVAGLMQLAADVRGIFDGAGLSRDAAALKNLISYAADWSVWTGYQHPGEAGQWPHLDQLYAAPAVDLVAIDNYLPLSDWTTGTGGLDAANWSAPAPTMWPPTAATMNGLGLAGPPMLASLAYLKANIEGGEKYNWFYADSTNLGPGTDPLGSGLTVSRPSGDRAAQTRTPYTAGQQLLAPKMLRWWWNNAHQAVYDTGDGQGWVPRGAPSKWVPQSRSITFTEYGFPTCDRCTNQPNVFYDPKSTESFTPYWSAWDPAEGGRVAPRRDDTLAALGLQAVYEYWVVDGKNAASPAGLKMVEPAFMAAWNWDARPFPTFPLLGSVWGDAANWRVGNWLGGKGPALPPPAADTPPAPRGPYPSFPTLAGRGWSTRYRPAFATAVAGHVSGRESRATRRSQPTWEIEMTFDVLRMDVIADLQALVGFFGRMRGRATPFTVPVPIYLGLGSSLLCRFAEDAIAPEQFMTRLWELRSLKLVSVPA